MRKSISFILVIALILASTLSLSAVSIDIVSLNADKEIQPITVVECYNIAEEFTKKYYFAQQTSTRVDFKDSFYYTVLNDYLQITLDNSYYIAETRNVKSAVKNLIAETIDVKCSLLNYRIDTNTIELSIKVDIAIKYPNMNMLTYFGNSIDFLFIKSNGKYLIADVLFEDELSNDKKILSSTKWSLEKNELFIQDIINTVQQKNNEFRRNILDLDNYRESIWLEAVSSYNKSSENNTVAPKGTSSFNKRAMVIYAKRTAPLMHSSDNKLYYNGSSARGSSLAPYYYDFSAFQGSYDCTNFISHCLLAGGSTMKQNGNPNTGWYFNNINASGATTRSYTWSGVTQFGDMLLTNTGIGPHGSDSSVGLGDIIQFKYSDYNAGGYGHSTIITVDWYGDYLDNYTPQIGPIVNCGITSRSSNTSYRVDQNFYRKILNLDGGNNVVGYRCIYLSGYGY